METRDLIIKFLKTRGYDVAKVHSGDGRHVVFKSNMGVVDFTINGTKIKAMAYANHDHPPLLVDIYEPDSLTRLAEFVHTICVLRGLYVAN